MLDKIIDIIMTVLPFFGGRKKRQQMMQEVKEFSELVKEQYNFLTQQLEKVFQPERPCEGDAFRNLFAGKVSCRKLLPCNASIKSVSNEITATHESYQSDRCPLFRHS